MKPTGGSPIRPERDIGRLMAQLMCALFSLIGVVPLVAGYVAQTAPVQAWAVSETRRVLKEELGLEASFQANLGLLPLRLEVEGLVVPAVDGKAPALTAAQASITPRFFSLLAGQLDVGDIEVERSRARLVVKNGKLTNIAYKLPERTSREEFQRAPFTSLALTDTRLSLDVDGAIVEATTADVDVLIGAGNVFEVAVRMARTTLSRTRVHEISEQEPTTAVDEDVLCRLDARVRIENKSLLIRRLSLLGVADQSVKKQGAPDCALAESEKDPARVAARLSGFSLKLGKDKVESAAGHVVLRAPASIGNRFAKTYALRGWVGFVGDIDYDGSTQLPAVRGRLRGDALTIGIYKMADNLEIDLELSGDVIRIPTYRMRYADADVLVQDMEVRPLAKGVPIRARLVQNRGMTFQGLMRDLGVSPRAWVSWALDEADVRDVSGTLAPLGLEGSLTSKTRDFEVSDRAHDDPHRQHMIGIKAVNVEAKLKVTPDSFQFHNARTRFGRSFIPVRFVSIGLDDDVNLKLSVPKGAKVDLKDISPLADVTMSGIAELDAEMNGPSVDPVVTGNLKVKDFVLGGFSLGDVLGSKVRFQPLKVDITDAQFKKNNSQYRSPNARLNFETDAAIEVDGVVISEAMDLRDFMAIWHFEDDPRWTHVKGVGRLEGHAHYLFGGPRDACKGGALRVRGTTKLKTFEAFEEMYEGATSEFDFTWNDFEAGYRGFSLEVPSFAMNKGGGTLVGSARVGVGGTLRGRVVGSSVPISKIDALGPIMKGVSGSVTTAVGELHGSLDAIEGSVSATLSPLALGAERLPSSSFAVQLKPVREPKQSLGTSKCGQPIAPPFDAERYERDEPTGHFLSTGQLFGNQIEFEDLSLSVQRAKVWKGDLDVNGLDLGAVAEFFTPGRQTDLSGSVSGRVDIGGIFLERLAQSDIDIELTQLDVAQGGVSAVLKPQQNTLAMSNRALQIGGLLVEVKTETGPSGLFDLAGTISGLGKAPRADIGLTLRPTDLNAFTTLVPGVTKASGRINGALRLTGPLANLTYTGNVSLSDGELQVKAFKTPITELEVELAIERHQLRVHKAEAKLGAGTLMMQGSAPLSASGIGTANGDIQVRGVVLPLGDGIKATVDADLRSSYSPGGEEQSLPLITGDVMVTAFNYTRPMSMTADLASLAGQGRKTQVNAFDPDDEVVRFDVQVRSRRPFSIKNELVQADVLVGAAGLRLKGTNQRFGLLGNVSLKPGGHIRLRSHDFEIRQGSVTFNDLTRIAPDVDVTATTEYRRYDDSSGTANTGAGGRLGGQWRINLHAYGDPENLRIDLTSTPNLRQDDIFLLLTVGLTRTELDQTKSAGVGSSVALEALGTLSGADRAVTDAVPVIDDASMGSSYNPKTGRTEPTITIGKRLAERIRAQVTTGLSDSSEVRSRIRMQVSPQVSLEGSYDNVNDISNSSLGNVGADIRWRLEFD